ncbi:MAG: hypothetical protein D6736_08875 [Nitrospinota bacterium]|nr:MAG: hypothetical protein D6736_08875 [Nitrospinota bacterium]
MRRWWRKGKLFLVLSLLWWLMPQPGESTPLLQRVRFGDHGDFFRIVFDLRQPTPYRILEKKDRSILRVEFPRLRALPPQTRYQLSHPLVRDVHLALTREGVTGEIRGRQPIRVRRHFRLDNPPRIVLDLSPRPERQETPPPPEPSPAVSPSTAQQPPAPPPPAAEPEEASPPIKTGEGRSEALLYSLLQQETRLSPAALVKYAEDALAQQDFQTAYQAYTTILQRFPHYTGNHLIATRLADILREQHRYQQAIERYAEVIEQYPGSEGALISQIRMAELGVEFPDLLSSPSGDRYMPYRHPLSTLLRISEKYALSPLADVALFKAGVVLLKRHKLQAAREKFRQVLERSTEPSLRAEAERKIAETWEVLLTDLYQQGKPLQVLQTFFREKTALQQSPDFPLLLSYVADSYARLGLSEEALHIWNQVLEQSTTPDLQLQARFKQATLLAEEGRRSEAQALLLPPEHFSGSPLFGAVLFLLGKLAFQEQRFEEAVHYLTQAEPRLDDPSDQLRLLILLGKGYQALGKSRASQQAWQRCVDRIPSQTEAPPAAEECFLLLADTFFTQQRYQEALSLYEQVLSKFPQSPYRDQVRFRMVQIYARQKDEKGIEQVLAAIEQPFWQRMAQETLQDLRWQKQFAPLFASFQNQMLR